MDMTSLAFTDASARSTGRHFMNRRQLLAAIPAAVAALTASKTLAGATSHVDASQAILWQSEGEFGRTVIPGAPDIFPIRAGETLRVVVSDDHTVFNVYRPTPRWEVE